MRDWGQVFAVKIELLIIDECPNGRLMAARLGQDLRAPVVISFFTAVTPTSSVEEALFRER